MNVRKTVDKIMIFLLIAVTLGVLIYYSTVLFVSDFLSNEEYSAQLSEFIGKEISDIKIEEKQRVEKNDNDPLVKLLLATDGKLDSLLDAARIPSEKAKTSAVMYNSELDHPFTSLDSVVLSKMSSSMTMRIITSNEYKSSFPARVTKLSYMGEDYNVYSAGCTAEDIPVFSKEYELTFDNKLLGKVFRIEKAKAQDSGRNIKHTLSTGYKITVFRDCSVEYDMPDFFLDCTTKPKEK